MIYKVVSANEWLYPDSEILEEDCKEIYLSAARGTYAGCQIFIKNLRVNMSILWAYTPDSEYSKGGCAIPEVYQLIDVAIERNTGTIGFTAEEGDSPEDYTTRLAPFRVYDAMKPLPKKSQTHSNVEALYLCWRIPLDAEPGCYTGEYIFETEDGKCTIPVMLEVFSVTVPVQGTLAVTNWFSLSNIATRHNLEMWSVEHWGMIKQYGEMMRRGRQDHFWVPLNLIDMRKMDTGAYVFNFDRAERLIRIFFQLGFTCIEGGHVGTRIHFNDDKFVLTADRGIMATSPEGFAFLAQYLVAWRMFLEEHGWLQKTIQHVADEPIDNSAEDYRILSGIVRKFLPGIPLIDALERHDLGGSVDIWIPKNNYYEENQNQFETYRKLGDTLWFYTCCLPGGHYMNRLLDMPLIRTRFLHWGNFLYDLTGYLHWGFNQYEEAQDPFESNCPVHVAGNSDKRLPPGDTHIVYPGLEGPWGSMRLEAMRAGIEDYEIFKVLEKKDKKLADTIVRSCMKSFCSVNYDIEAFHTTHRLLLEKASQNE